MLNVDRIKKQFPIFKKYPELRFFDSAASALKHRSVIDKLTDYLKFNGVNVHRGVYKLASDATELYEQSRRTVADFINADEKEVVFTKSTTHGLNMLAKSLAETINPGDEIIISELEHHSNLLPWVELASQKQAVLKFIPLEDGKITLTNFKKVLSNQTKLVITHYLSNVMGFTTPLKEMIKAAHQVGALVVVDAAQSISHLKTDVKKLDVDFLAFSGHKMYGPNGVGVLFGKFDLLEKLTPAEFGGEMVDKVNLNGSSYKETPYKFEAGTPAIAEAIALSAAIEFLSKTGLKKIHQHEVELKNYIVSHLKDEDGIEIYNQDADSGLITFNIKDVHPHDTASFLDQYGVAVRAGHHCNQLTMKYLNQDSTVRASVAVYNTIDDCDIFIKAVKETRDFFKTL